MSGSGKFDRSAKNFKDGIDSLFIPEGCIQKRRRIKGTSTSTAAGRESEIDNEKFTELMLSASSSSEEEGTPVGILVSSRNVSELSPNLPCLSHGSISVIGRRRVMEDMVTVAPGVLAGDFASSYDFFAVYDGHGGSSVSQTCRERMHQLLAKEVEGWTGGGEGGRIDWEKVMVGCFSKMDDEVNKDAFRADDGFVSVMRMGSTAVVALVGKEEIVVANCGDSRAVLYRGGNVVQLSRDHKPDSLDEKQRIEAAGGRIVDWNGCRVEGVLATSRSIGDHYLKPYVISEPEVTIIERTETDYFLIIASDGLWDVVTNEVACDIVRRCLDGQMKRSFSSSGTTSSAAESAAILAELAMGRGSKDNISVIVVELKESNHNNVS